VEIREGWVALLVLVAFLFGLLIGTSVGMGSKCNSAWLAAHNQADSVMVRRVCEAPHA